VRRRIAHIADEKAEKLAGLQSQWAEQHDSTPISVARLMSEVAAVVTLTL